MQQSSRRTPCPSCGRTRDGDCRWNAGAIWCHQGSHNGPDPELRIGDVIDIDGKPWALVSLDAGFAGSAALFRPHRERSDAPRRHIPRTPTELLSQQTKRHQWASVLDQFHNAFQRAWDVPDFYTASPDELSAAFAVIDDAQAKAAAIRPHLDTIWREHKDLEQLHRLRTETELKVIDHAADDARDFQRNELGVPTAADLQEVAG